MSIYTRFGDDGQTQRIDGETISKASPRVDALGTVDELSSHIGLCVAEARAMPGRIGRMNKVRRQRLVELAASLENVQRHLFGIESMLAAAGTGYADAVRKDGITEETISQMEAWIDWVCHDMPPLENFILPGGSELASRLHVARTVCRRAERTVIRFGEETPLPPLVLAYLNRLGDTLFALARLANFDDKGHDTLAKPNGNIE